MDVASDRARAPLRPGCAAAAEAASAAMNVAAAEGGGMGSSAEDPIDSREESSVAAGE
jgi:hypothetical protein